MKLKAIMIQNYRCVGKDEICITIDEIVVLIGQNNIGKSTVLDAYEAYCDMGQPKTIHDFHNNDASQPISITGVFTEINEEDVKTFGGKYLYNDVEFGESVKVKWVWEGLQKGQKYSWDNVKSEWVLNGVGGWDSLFISCIPQPLRVGPTDLPEDREARIIEILISAMKSGIKDDASKTQECLDKIEELALEFSTEVKKDINHACEKVSEYLGQIFFGFHVSLEIRPDKFEPEKMIKAGSYLGVTDPHNRSLPISNQGTGMQRAFLWSALSALADLGHEKKGKKAVRVDRPRILLIDEPETFLHPPAIRAARDSLYGISELEDWQVIVTTHSPVFIDVSKPHTTIVRMNNREAGLRKALHLEESIPSEIEKDCILARSSSNSLSIFQTSKTEFSDDERTNLKMIRSCNPHVSEFFFADLIFLVEGETEHIVLSYLIEKYCEETNDTFHVVNCLGKANIPTFAKILNQFQMPYMVLHDSDAPKSLRKDGTYAKNAMWTMNEKIRSTVDESIGLPLSKKICVHVPDFEGYYFGETLTWDKPFNAIRHLSKMGKNKDVSLNELSQLIPRLLNGSHPSLCETTEDVEILVKTYSENLPEEDRVIWQI